MNQQAELGAYDRFMGLMTHLAAMRADRPCVALYERWKADFVRDCPDATPEQYAAAMQAIARAAGV